MELRQLRYFVKTAELLSFTQAAEACCVSQPSLSQQIGKLEHEMGRVLFDRQGSRITLTGAGRLLLAQAQSILGAVDTAKRSIDDAIDAGCGYIAVGVIPTIAPYWLPTLLTRFHAAYPNIEVTIYEERTAELVANCVSGDIDLGILALPIPDPRVTCETLCEEPLLLAAPQGHELLERERVTRQDLEQAPFILIDETHCLGEQIVNYCNRSEHPSERV